MPPTSDPPSAAQDTTAASSRLKQLLRTGDLDGLAAFAHPHAVPSLPPDLHDEYGSILLLAISIAPSASVAEWLVSHSLVPADLVNATHPTTKETPLHVAARTGRNDLISVLLTVPGLNDGARDANNRQALDVACTDAVRERLAMHQKQFVLRATATMHELAAADDLMGLVNLFRDPRTLALIDINHRNPLTGDTILHTAARRGNDLMVRWCLTDQHADPFLRDTKGLYLDRITSNNDIKELFNKMASNTEDPAKPSAASGQMPRLAGILKKWVSWTARYRERWFTLEGGALQYYKREGDAGNESRRRGTIHLKNAQVVTDPSNGRLFQVIDDTATRHYLFAEHVGEASRWIQAIGQSIAMLSMAADSNPLEPCASSTTEPQEKADMPVYRFIVGLDFGITHIGFGYCSASNKGMTTQDISVKACWEHQPHNFFACKVPVVASYHVDNPRHKLFSWASRMQPVDARFAQVDRVMLHLDKSTPDDMKPALPEGMTAVDVIADFLAWIRNELFDMIQRRQPMDLNLQPNDFLFCFTASAAWSQQALDSVRFAAVKAGIIEAQHSPNLIFCDEPEAAALSYTHECESGIEPGSKILIADCGGSTSKLFLIAFDENRKVNSVSSLDQLGIGATLVDASFWALIERTLGQEAFARLMSDAPFQLLCIELAKKWESCKRRFSGQTQDSLLIQLPQSIVQLMPPKEVVDLEDRELRLTDADLRNLFDPLISDILDIIKSELEQLETPDLDLYVVGGLASNAYVRKRFAEDDQLAKLVNKCVFPRRPDAAVLTGAILHAIDRSSVYVDVQSPSRSLDDDGTGSSDTLPVDMRDMDNLNADSRLSAAPAYDGEQHAPPTKRIVVAVDFGTSHSGYAFGKDGLYEALGNPAMARHIGSLIHVRENWPGATTRYPKTLSATLFDYDGQPVAHGDLALAKYLELRGKAIQQHALVRRIKLLLADDYSYNDPFLNKHHLEPSQIIADFLTYFKRDVEEQLQRAGYKPGVGECSINWVVTIPAMWTESAKATMQASAKLCGLLENGGQVVFCLEPEAALLNCAIATNLIKHGDCVLVVDMGGGTVDLAAFQVSPAADQSTWHGLKFDSIAKSDGCTSGATLFDDAFYAFFCRLVGLETLDSLDPESKVHLFQEWERVKRTFEGDSDPPRWVKLDPKLQRKLSQQTIEELVDQDRYDMDRGEVSVLPDEIIECFEKVYPSILAVTLRMLSNAKRASKSINKLLCVGGFSEMRYLQQRIRDDFSFHEVEVIFPLDSGASVVQGALLYGIDPEAVPHKQS